MLHSVRLGPDTGHITVEAPEIAELSRPGNFLMLRTWEGEPQLPRAMAPLRYDTGRGRVEIYYRIKGSGTEALTKSRAGDRAYLTGPLGTAITRSFQGTSVALVGRGVGITPLLPLAEWIARTGGSPRAYLSARTRGYLFGSERFAELGGVHDQVDDEPGGDPFVTLSLQRAAERGEVDEIYACGSRRLVRHAHEIGTDLGIPVMVFLEEKMGCGTGFCKGCPVQLRNGSYDLVCTSGPLFPTSELAAL